MTFSYTYVTTLTKKESIGLWPKVEMDKQKTTYKLSHRLGHAAQCLS